MKNFSKIDSGISYIYLNKRAPENYNEIFSSLTYFDDEIENQLDDVLDILNSDNVPDSLVADKILLLQAKILQKQNEIYFSYDCLLYCSLLLASIAIIKILYNNFLTKSEIIKKESFKSATQKFSRDLHDGVAQDIAALKFFLQKKDLETAEFYADQTFKEVRFLIDSMHFNYDCANFEAFVNQTINSFSTNHKIKADFFCASTSINHLNVDFQIEIYRIIHEALSNISKHADASYVTLKITDTGTGLNIIIHDNGKGLELENVNDVRNGHHGLTNIKKRVQSLKGTVEFINNEGTTIAISFKNPIY